MSTRTVLLSTALAVGVLLMTGAGASAQLSQDQQKCVNKVNKDGSKVAQAQGKENAACVKNFGKGLLTGTAQACLTADTKQKVQTKKDKTVADALANCAPPPSFGFTSAAAVNTAAQQGELDLIADVFGANLDAGLFTCAANPAGCSCQFQIIKDLEKLAKTKLGEFVKCKRLTLKNGANSAAALEACVAGPDPNSVAADPKGKIAKKFAKLGGNITAKCASVSGAFPGVCNSFSGAALQACLDVRVECRVCQTINEMDGLFVNCDLFDDGVANTSCLSGVGPTPTPTVTTVPTNTPTATPTNTLPPGVEFKGALLQSTGRFTYNATVGISGANALCNNIFPTTHACSFPELEIAEAAGDLIGAEDINNNPVTSFWAIDSTHPATSQCHTIVPWDYQTAHTGHQSEHAVLNPGTGVLGPSVLSFSCGQQYWVGCCL